MPADRLLDAPLPPLSPAELELPACRGIFAAVLLRAIRDAAGRTRDGGNPGSIGHFADAARAWLARGGPDFELICHFAGIDPERVRRAVRHGRLGALAADAQSERARHTSVVAATHRAQADALEIESRAKRRLADEYDAAQERGEVATRENNPGSQGASSIREDAPATAAEIGLTYKQIHEARMIRNAEEAGAGPLRRLRMPPDGAGRTPGGRGPAERTSGALKRSRGISGLFAKGGTHPAADGMAFAFRTDRRPERLD